MEHYYLGMVLFARITLVWHILVHAIILWNWATLISNIYRKLGYWLQVPLPVVHVLVVSASVVNAGNQSPLTSSSSLSLLSPSVTSCVSVNGGTLGLNQATDTQHMVTSAAVQLQASHEYTRLSGSQGTDCFDTFRIPSLEIFQCRKIVKSRSNYSVFFFGGIKRTILNIIWQCF